MFALRERRVHVTQEDFEMAVAKVMKKDTEKNMSLRKLWKWGSCLVPTFHGLPEASAFIFLYLAKAVWNGVAACSGPLWCALSYAVHAYIYV